MSSDTLLLSSAFEPLRVVGWQRAMSLLIEGRVDVITNYENRVVHCVDGDIPIPSILRYKGKVRRRYRPRRVRFCRKYVFLRDEGVCQYCGVGLSYYSFDYEHVIPKSKGGETTFTNIVASCKPCNRHKGDRTPEEAGMKLRKQPTVPTYLPGTHEDLPEKWSPWMPAEWKDYLF